MFAILVLDKPQGPTCQQLLLKFRKTFPKIKVGFTGTLDPFATGVLPIFLGNARKLIPFLDENKKIYEAKIKLGVQTDTLDSTGEIVQTQLIPRLEFEKVNQALKSFMGKHLQTPPLYSAVKVRGKPLYRYARKGKTVEIKPREVEIFSIEYSNKESEFSEKTNAETLSFKVEVSRGTYIRSLGVDIAKSLGTIGHLVELRRIQSGPFCLEQSITEPLNEFLNKNSLEQIQKKSLSPQKLLSHFKVVQVLDTSLSQRILWGQTIPIHQTHSVFFNEEKFEEGKKYLLVDSKKLLSISKCVSSPEKECFFKPMRVLNLEGLSINNI